MSWKTKLDNRLENDSILNDYIDEFEEYLNDAVNTFDVNINHSTSTIEMVIQNTSALDKTVVVNNEVMLGLTVLSDIVVVGNIVTWKNEDWIVVSKDTKAINNCNKIYIQKSNNTLLFYPPLSNENPILYEIPCIVGNISIGNETNKYINTVDNTVPLTLPNTEITRQIKVNDTYKLGLSNYTISSVGDDISVPGLLIFKMEYSEAQQILPSYSLTILNGESIQVNQNDSLKINAKVTDTTNNIILSSPDLLFESSNISVATIDSITGVVTILGIGNVEFSCKWLFGSNVVMDVISVEIVSVAQSNYTYTLVGNISPDVEIKSGQTKTFTAHKFNNGIEILSAEFDFSIVENEVPNAYTFAVLNSNSCSIKCNQYTYYILLKAIDKSDNTKFIEKTIKLRSII